MPIHNSEKNIIGVTQLINKLNGEPFNDNDVNIIEVRSKTQKRPSSCVIGHARPVSGSCIWMTAFLLYMDRAVCPFHPCRKFTICSSFWSLLLLLFLFPLLVGHSACPVHKLKAAVTFPLDLRLLQLHLFIFLLFLFPFSSSLFCFFLFLCL